MGKKKGKNKKKEELEIEVEVEAETEEDISLGMVELYGPVSEEKSAEVIDFLLKYSYGGQGPIQFLISTHGGLASEMFAIYDVMRMTRENTEILTLGLGKVMSAGVLLLAAGSKGGRQIGANCKVMIHGLKAEQGGYLATLQNDLEELHRLEESYIKVLSDETNMSKRYVKKLFNKKLDVFLSAEEAVDLGIADIIV